MIITPLGHTEFLVDIAPESGKNVRILVDTWLSDYAIGDLMERSVKVKLDPEKMRSIDLIYISHSHCDHLDPYTLIEIYRYSSPTLLIPFTLAYLKPIFHEYLPKAKIETLFPHRSYLYEGIEITGYMWPNVEITNEDDVMMIAIASKSELLFAEIDTVPDGESEEVQKSLFSVFTKRPYETRCYLASRNMLEGQIPYYDLSEGKRKGFRDQFIASQKEEMIFSYEKYEYEEFAHFPNIFTLPGFVRGFIGQGIRYPVSLSPSLANLSLFPLEEIASLESDLARHAGYDFPQKALLPGRQYKLGGGVIEPGRKECPIGELVKNEEGKMKSENTERLFAPGPLFPRDLTPLEVDHGKKVILEILNTRFLPYWSASQVASIREALRINHGIYRIECRIKEDKSLLFEYSTSRSGFIEVPYEENIHLDEDYWLCDILDFLDGRQEMYSSFWHRLHPKRVYRLWTCLGATYMNHDLVEKKYRLHFERAHRGEDPVKFVQLVYSSL